jgi:hypothetical protein
VSDKVIYAPKGQAGEYAPLATNLYKGCGHRCAYCWVPSFTHQSRADFDSGAVPKENFIERLRKDAAQYQAAGITDQQILLCFSTDPYHGGDTTLTREALIVLREYRLSFCVLSKGGTRALRDSDLFRSDRDCYAATLTSLSNTFSRKWEKNAPLPGDRIAALNAFHEKGIFTWVSLEPTLHIEASLSIGQSDPRIRRFVQGRQSQLLRGDHQNDRLATLHIADDRFVEPVGQGALYQARPPALPTARLSQPLTGTATPLKSLWPFPGRESRRGVPRANGCDRPYSGVFRDYPAVPLLVASIYDDTLCRQWAAYTANTHAATLDGWTFVSVGSWWGERHRWEHSPVVRDICCMAFGSPNLRARISR